MGTCKFYINCPNTNLFQMSEYLRPAFAIVLPNIGGIAGGFLTKKAIPDWYEVSR